jgi:hypothetical protein
MVDNATPFTAAANAGQSSLTVAVTTPGPNRTLVAVVVWGSANNAPGPIAVTGGGLSWTRQLSETIPSGMYTGWYFVEVWTAPAPLPLSAVVITANATGTVIAGGSGAVAIWSFVGDAVLGTSGVAYNDAMASGPIDVVVPGTTAGCFVIGGACNDGGPSGPLPYTAYAGNTQVVGAWDSSTRVRCAIWELSALSTGGDVTIGSTAPVAPRWVIAGAEITAR